MTRTLIDIEDSVRNADEMQADEEKIFGLGVLHVDRTWSSK